MGSINEDGSWAALKLGMEHTSENLAEVERLYSEHPASEQDTIIRMDRLLGQLMPLRAFGDFRFKWPRQVSYFYNISRLTLFSCELLIYCLSYLFDYLSVYSFIKLLLLSPLLFDLI